ncbi:exodeoxyribonuclease V [Bifidobacterium parmae]|uniref:Exodeoxyribonuclease V n=1 Tax=Bifidobacterium parmae TaxID=361854 RepID=A0A2N5J5W2_9BIFI|nr:exodeoxyribonuclease V [Bifidobacterium parmae]
MIRWLLVAFALTLTGFDWSARPAQGTYPLVIAVLHCVAIVAVGVIPRIGSMSMMLVELACCFSQPVGGPSRLWGVCLSLGILSYAEGTVRAVVLGASIYALMQITQLTLFHGTGASGMNLPGSIFIISFMLTIALLGYTFRLISDKFRSRERMHEHTLRELEYEHQEQQLQIAARMHDFVADKLANIIMRTEMDSQPDSTAWHDIHDEARAALDELHAIIDVIRQSDTDTPVAGDAVNQQLAEICAVHDRALATMGLHGEGTVKDWGLTTAPQPDRIRLAAALIGELYTNIGRYADKEIPYQMSITLHDDHLEIVQTNGIATSQRTTVSGGRGLAIYAQRISHIQGILAYVPHEGEWSCYALVPLTDTTAAE